MKHPHKGLFAAAMIASFAMAAVACTDVSSSTTPGGSGSAAVPENSGTTITIAVNPWTGSAANANVAANLLRDKLGYDVQLVEVDEYAQFPALSKGDLDATLEVWPSGHGPDYTKYIDGGKGVVDGGQLGITGQIGWYVPTYMLTDHPELSTWEGVKQDADLFKTAESGNAGQILDGADSFVTFDQFIANNLGMNLKVVYAGSEDSELAELDSAYQDNAPILMYFWTPHWAQAKYDLTKVELPAVTPACTAAASQVPPTDYACDYPPDPLYKAFNADLQTKAPAAYAFLSAMQYTIDDQLGISKDISDDVDPSEAAQKWLDANPAVWQPWVDAGLAAQS
jgi:glycine betaine/proline transport system substrate-binding protein